MVLTANRRVKTGQIADIYLCIKSPARITGEPVSVKLLWDRGKLELADHALPQEGEVIFSSGQIEWTNFELEAGRFYEFRLRLKAQAPGRSTLKAVLDVIPDSDEPTIHMEKKQTIWITGNGTGSKFYQ